MNARIAHIAALLENQPDLSNVRIGRLTGATQYQVAKFRAAMGVPALGWRQQGKRT